MFFQNGVDLYYEVHGRGEPLVLIAGLTAHSGNWPAQLPVFAEERKTILIDNRNSGRSAVTEDGSIPAMADDVAALMDHLGMAGAQDILITEKEQKTLLEKIPDTRWLCLQGSGHGVHADRTERFNKAVLDFLA